MSAGMKLAGSGVGRAFRARVECDGRARRCLMDNVHYRLEQRQAFRRNSEATADHHTVIGGALQLFF